MLTAATPVAYAVEQPSSGKRKLTSMRSGWGVLLKPGRAARGFLYLLVVMDWYSRYVVAWRLSNTLEAGSCAEALEEALGRGRPEVFKPTRAASSRAGSPPMPCNTAG